FRRCTGSNMPVVGCGLRVIGAVPMPQPIPLGFAQIFPSNKRCVRPSAHWTIEGACFRYGGSTRAPPLAAPSFLHPSSPLMRRLFMVILLRDSCAWLVFVFWARITSTNHDDFICA